MEQLTLALFSSLSPSGVPACAKTHFCDVPQWQVHLFCQLEEKGENSWMVNERENAPLLFPLFIHPLFPPLLSGCLFISGLGSTDWLLAKACRVTLGPAANTCKPEPHSPAAPILMCQHWWGYGDWRATRLSSMARVPWEKARGAKVLMLSDLVKTKVTALLPE